MESIGMKSGYQGLMGGIGAERNFRAERFPVREWLNRVRPVLIVDGEPRGIHDLSMNGAAYYVRSVADAPPLDSEWSVVLALDTTRVYEGRGQVTRVEPTMLGAKVGLRLTDGFLDIYKIVDLHDELALGKELERGPASDAALLGDEYRRVCGDTVHLMRSYRSLLDRYEALLSQGDDAAQARLQRICRACEERFRGEWNLLRGRANQLVEGFADRKVRAAAKRFTLQMVTPEFMIADNWRRCKEKPLGYPGDFEIMNMLYAGEPRGTSAFARLVYQMGLEQPIAACVTPRMELLSDLIRQTMELAWDQTGPLEIASLGCGPAREMERYLEQYLPRRPLHVTLIDQDYQALSFAYGRVYRHMARMGGSASADCLYLSFAQLLKSRDIFDKVPPQHLVYSAGLFDYLDTARSQALIRGLYGKLVPGGALIIGNMKAPTDGRWSIEFILDWPLIYRDETQMRELAALVPDAQVEIGADSTGYTYLMTVRKPLV